MDRELIIDNTNRDLGYKKHKCRICNAEGMFRSYLVREMLVGTKDEFEYFECPECLCLQIADVPENLGDYYKESYYSFNFEAEDKDHFETEVDDNTKVLDMGCGSGSWLYEMAKQGCGNLYGCDPFIDNDRRYGDRVYIKKCDISEIEGDGTFDMVRMRDSLEHVTNPQRVVDDAARLLKDTGIVWINIPAYPNFIFDMYGPHWYSLDAPRHIFLPSVKCIKYLAENSGLRINEVDFDTINGNVVISYFYKYGIPRNVIDRELISSYFSDEDISKLNSICEKQNNNNYGDHMKILLKKK